MNSSTSTLVAEQAPLILAEINKAKSVLLHCHPAPDPDSVGSALAMKFALEQLGKKATVIQGDSDIPQAFMHFPGAKDIVKKSYLEIDPKEFDLFIVLDGASLERITRKGEVSFPASMTTVTIDHHRTNSNFASVNLVDSSYPSTAQMLFELFMLWGIKLDANIASNLFIGIFTDTGGFKYAGTTDRTFAAASELIKHVPDFPKLISKMENSWQPSDLAYQALAFSAVQEFFGGKVALSLVTLESLKEKGVATAEIGPSTISTVMRFVEPWIIAGALVETHENFIQVSFRSKDGDECDVSKLASALGGGGHKAAAGVTMRMPLAEAKEKVVSKIKELYNL